MVKNNFSRNVSEVDDLVKTARTKLDQCEDWHLNTVRMTFFVDFQNDKIPVAKKHDAEWKEVETKAGECLNHRFEELQRKKVVQCFAKIENCLQ